MGTDDLVVMDEAVEDRAALGGAEKRLERCQSSRSRSGWIVVAAACFVFLLNIVSPPRLMDDVDAVQAQIARNMLESGDWVTARLDGVAYLEKARWFTGRWQYRMESSACMTGLRVFRSLLAVVLLCWITYRFGRWAFR